MNFQAHKTDQNYRRNTEASICQNCANLEIHTPAQQTGKPLRRLRCGVGRFYVEKEGTCRMYESK